MAEQLGKRVEVATQVFFTWHEMMYRFMTIAAERHGSSHGGPIEVLLEPFVRMASSRDQMMLCGSSPGNAIAKLTGSGTNRAHKQSR